MCEMLGWFGRGSSGLTFPLSKASTDRGSGCTNSSWSSSFAKTPNLQRANALASVWAPLQRTCKVFFQVSPALLVMVLWFTVAEMISFSSFSPSSEKELKMFQCLVSQPPYCVWLWSETFSLFLPDSAAQFLGFVFSNYTLPSPTFYFSQNEVVNWHNCVLTLSVNLESDMPTSLLELGSMAEK